MASAQLGDLRSCSRACGSPAEARAVAEGKAGEQLRGFGRAAARLAGAGTELVARYGDVAAGIGTAAQLHSDLTDLHDPGGSSDLRNGTRTLAIAHARQALREDDAEALASLLDTARTRPDVHAKVRRRLAEAGSLAFTAVVVEVYRARARTALDAARPREPAATGLRRILDDVAVLRPTA